MIRKYIKGKTFVFIDASNVYYSQKRLKWHLDFLKLKGYLEAECSLGKIFYYTARDESSEKQNKFIDFLEKSGFVVRSKKIKFIKNGNLEKDGFFKGNLDVELTIDVLEEREDYDTIILVSGDSDFKPLLKLIKKKYYKKCLVMATKHNVSIELIKSAKFINLAKLKKYLKKV